MNESDRDRRSRKDATMTGFGKALGQPSSGKRSSPLYGCLAAALLAAAAIAIVGMTLHAILNWLKGLG